MGSYNDALAAINRALRINPNYSQALWFKGILEIWFQKNFREGLKILHNVVRYEHGPQLPSMLVNLGYIYFQLGLYDLSQKYNLAYAGISGDSSKYYYYLSEEARVNGDYDRAGEYLHYLYSKDTLKLDFLLGSAWIAMMKNDYKSALQSLETYDKLTSFRLDHMHRLGYLFWVMGDKNTAIDYFDEQIMVCNENIKLNRWYANRFREAYYDLAGIYFFTGDKDQGFKCLKEFGNQIFVPPWMIEIMKIDPLFESVREAGEFNFVLNSLAEKTELEKSRVLQMLEEEGFLENPGF